MTVTVEKLQGEPIVVATFTEPLDAAQDTRTFNREIGILAEQMDEPIYLVADLTAVDIGFSDAVLGLAEAARGEMAFFKNPQLKHVVLVGLSGFLSTLTNWAKQAQYGGGKSSEVARSLDEGLALCREKVVEHSRL